STALILVFYLVFYTFLTGLFCLTMWVLLQTVDDYKPTYQDRLATPGLMIRPKCEALEIDYDIAKTESWDDYITALDSFLARESWCGERRRERGCTHLGSESESEGVLLWRVSRDELNGGKGGEEWVGGIIVNSVCLTHSLNVFQVIGMKPGSGESPYVTCGAKFGSATRTHTHLQFGDTHTLTAPVFPLQGLKAQRVNYSQPLVAVKFLNITFNSDVNVECKIVARDIKVDAEQRDKFAGRVSFKLRINK
uniref:Sodium/potassium-transporting ATPase subunit beta-2 n=1 Tax=Lepisosteus oculatus TaxID=7918 RepID=W5N7T0_LEPOC